MGIINGLLLQMTRGSRVYDFIYDANGNPVSIAYRSRATANPLYYYYGTNYRGDVEALYDSNGLIVALYEYDAYGKLLSVETSSGMAITSETNIAIVNPLRYRGYVYDNETSLYYLQSRYYDPTTCRFVNADGYCATGQGITGNNMFAYCNNNPVMRSDPSGKIFGTAILIAGVCLYVNYRKEYKSVSEDNYSHNSAVDKIPNKTTQNKILNNQFGNTGKNFEYGKHSAYNNSCETIAVHNAKVLLGMDSTLSDTMKDCQDAGAMIGYGYFGTNPYAIGGVLRDSGVGYSRVRLKGMTEPGIYIFSYWNEEWWEYGLHTVAISYDGLDYIAYNLECDGRAIKIDPSTYRGSFICAYYLG